MTSSWFFAAFPWIGGAAAVVLAVLLFATNSLRTGQASSRWRDPRWLSWMAVVAYLLHNVEEYGLDLRGQTNAFPDVLCANFGLPPYPNCPIPPQFFLAVNIPLFWVVGPLVALLGARHSLMGFALYSVISINALAHLAAVVTTGQPYNPGLLTALILFIPLTACVGYNGFRDNRLTPGTMVLLPACGVILHMILAGSLAMFLKGWINAEAVVWSQIVNAALLVLIVWLAERRRGGAVPCPARNRRSGVRDCKRGSA